MVYYIDSNVQGIIAESADLCCGCKSLNVSVNESWPVRSSGRGDPEISISPIGSVRADPKNKGRKLRLAKDKESRECPVPLYSVFDIFSIYTWSVYVGIRHLSRYDRHDRQCDLPDKPWRICSLLPHYPHILGKHAEEARTSDLDTISGNYLQVLGSQRVSWIVDFTRPSNFILRVAFAWTRGKGKARLCLSLRSGWWRGSRTRADFDRRKVYKSLPRSSG